MILDHLFFIVSQCCNSCNYRIYCHILWHIIIYEHKFKSKWPEGVDDTWIMWISCIWYIKEHVEHLLYSMSAGTKTQISKQKLQEFPMYMAEPETMYFTPPSQLSQPGYYPMGIMQQQPQAVSNQHF